MLRIPSKFPDSPVSYPELVPELSELFDIDTCPPIKQPTQKDFETLFNELKSIQGDIDNNIPTTPLGKYHKWLPMSQKRTNNELSHTK